MPDPPAGLNTAIPEPSEDAKTLKERLVMHMEVEECAFCHEFIDPIGFGVERFDGIGRFRLTDKGATIDPSGVIDDMEFQDATDLTELLANDARTVACMVKKVYSFGTGRPVSSGERGEIERLVDRFVADGHRLKALMIDVAASEGFRSLAEVTE